MSTTIQGPRSGSRDRVVLGIILIAVGIGALVLQTVETTTSLGGWIVLFIGLGFLGAFAYTRQYGYLVPGGIMSGLGGGIAVSENLILKGEETGGVIVLGLGLGFVGIWVVGAVVQVSQHHWWPLIPGAILGTIGTALLIGDQAVALLDYWGVALVAIGLIVLWRAVAGGRTNPSG